MRGVLTLKLLRRSSPSPPPATFHLLSYYSSTSCSSHSISTGSTHQQRRRHYCFRTQSSLRLQLLSPHSCLSLSRALSTQPDFFGSDESFLPVRVLISLLDSYHDLTGLPWWVIISSSTVAMRFALFPLTVLQLKKLRRIEELMPNLPPPFPPPLSGRSFREQISLFLEKKKALGGPSVFWFVASFAAQVPFFFLWIMSVRRMSLGNHPGFDCGGTLWFQNLTEYPHGLLGPIFPLFIGGLHFVAVQISFKSSLQELRGPLGLLAKAYKIYLQLLTLPILFAAFNVPQGSLIYWLTNSSLSLVQLICLRHPVILEHLGIPKRNAPVITLDGEERGYLGTADTSKKKGSISAHSLSPRELLDYSIKLLNDGRRDTALKLLRLALEKDPGNVRASIVLGQTLLLEKQYAQSAEGLENAVSKLLAAGHPTAVEEIDLLIVSSMYAGLANLHQGKMEKGLLHLERIAQLEEPVDSGSKKHYFDGLFLLSGILLDVGRKAEALKYLQKAAAFDANYNVYLKQAESRSEDFGDDLASSRRYV